MPNANFTCDNATQLLGAFQWTDATGRDNLNIDSVGGVFIHHGQRYPDHIRAYRTRLLSSDGIPPSAPRPASAFGGVTDRHAGGAAAPTMRRRYQRRSFRRRRRRCAQTT